MFENEIATAPKQSDRLKDYIIAQGVVAALDRLTDAIRGSEVATATQNDVITPDKVEEAVPEVPFPHFDTTTDEGPVENPTDLTAAVDATINVDEGSQ
jgi:hypothetical protein